MDGVIVDTTDLHFWSWSVALQEQGLALSHQDFLSTFGKNNFAFLHQFFGPLPNELIQTISDRKEILFRQSLDGKIVIIPGALD
jgi:beta-phosphoglucomutase-like phosphatase (HAD superfamily)